MQTRRLHRSQRENVVSFVELNRDFVRLQADQPYRAEIFEGIRLFSSGGEKWPSLLGHERVVVLAEAASGKSEEFREQARTLRDARAFAIYLPIERLEKNGLLGSLGIDDRAAFATWQRGAAPGWFFLDSIDEARIHHKDVESALNRFAADLGETYDRARVLLSCRGSVWAGEKDLALINMTLPIRNRVGGEDTAPVNSDAILLDRPENATSASKKEFPEPGVRLVALAKITRSQRSAFLTAEKVADIEAAWDEISSAVNEQLVDLQTFKRFPNGHYVSIIAARENFDPDTLLQDTPASDTAGSRSASSKARAAQRRLSRAVRTFALSGFDKVFVVSKKSRNF